MRIDRDGGFHASPIVIDGIIYLATANVTAAIDGASCDYIWKAPYVPEAREVFGTVRGVAVSGGRVYRGTIDGRLLALDAMTGQLLWKVAPADPSVGEYTSSAPIVHDGRVFMGIAGGDFGIVGRMLAFEAATGRRLWSFNLVPQGREPGADTWKGDTNKRGGGGTWSSYTLDPASNELFVPVGNPAPDFQREHRLGANLYTNSLVVLDMRSGRLRWWYQLTPSDDRDWDYVAPPMLFTLKDGRRVVALGHKDGYVHVVDRETHELVYRTQITTIKNADLPVTREGTFTCPGLGGGVQWNGPALDPPNEAFVVGSVDWCAIYRVEPLRFEPGQLYYGGSFSWVMDPPPSGWITSIDKDSGVIRWRFRAPAPVVSGITPTAGGVVFAGDLGGQFYVFRSSDGQILFREDTGGAIAGGISTYLAEGRQFVAVTSGNISRMIWGAVGTPSLIIYSVPADGGGLVGPSPGSGVPMPNFSSEAESALDLPAGDTARGARVYAQLCAVCHGNSGEGNSGVPLRGIANRLDAAEITDRIINPKTPMPKLFPSPLDEQGVADVSAYVRTLQ